MRVLNRGYSEKKKEWKTAEGKAYFVKESDRIFELDQRNYEYAIISGPSKSYLWILARTPELEPGLKQKLIFRAAALGFDTTKLILPEQKQPPS